MPPLPPVARVVLVRLKGVYGTQPWNAILHLQYSGPAPTAADLASIANLISNAWGTDFAPMAGTNVVLNGIDLADLSSSTSATNSVTTSVAGTRAGTTFAASIACVVSWKINSRYRGGHPRSYFPLGVYGDQNTITSWTLAFKNAVQAAATAFRTALNSIAVSGATYQMVSVAYRRNNVALDTPIPYTIVNNVVHGRIDTQRRRLGKETP